VTSKPPVLIMANHIDGLGGAERSCHTLAAGLAARGYDVALRGIRPSAGETLGARPTAYSTGFMSSQTDIETVRLPGVPARLDRRYQRLRAARRDLRKEAVAQLRATLAGYREGIFIPAQVFVMEHVSEIGIEDVLAAGTRIIGQYHSSYDAARGSGDFARLSRTYRQIDKFLLLTEEDATRFQQHNFNNTGWMPNALPHFPQDWRGERENLVVSIARYDRNKTLDHSLRAWASVAADFPGWRFELYGEGPERPALEALIAKLGISGSARLMGLTDQVEAVLLRSKVNVLSSQFEGLPMVLGEAMACGVPSVSYDSSPGVREIITDGVDGLVVPKNKTDLLAQAMRALMSDEAQRLRLAETARVSAERFTIDAVMDRWEDLFARTLR
jgi:glycosyltransferase involved in cell wall biosynthesis